MKGRTKIGPWNVRTLCEEGKAAQMASGMRHCNISVLAISRWNGAGQATPATGERLLYCGHEEEQQNSPMKDIEILLGRIQRPN